MKKFCIGKSYFTDRHLRKILLIMKLSAILLFFIILQSTAGVLSQTISVDVKNQSVRDVLRMIESQSDYRFFYNDRLSGLNNPVDLKAENTSLEDVLSQLLDKQQFSYTALENNMIVIAPKEFIQQSRISGRVTDVNGGPLPGVSIIVKGMTIGTITDLEGRFELAVPENAQILVFSFMGMRTQEINIVGLTTVDVVLVEDAIGLEELVVVGYGTQKRVNLTGSLTIINADELAQVSMPTISQGLMGRSPGVFIKNKKGQPGEDGIDINIRGFGSPLIIVDGTPVSSAYFQQIEPGDIESFNVLKDASAGAVYGARAGNGVILITTKRGTTSAPQFSYNGNYAQQFFTNVPDFVDAATYTSMFNVGRTTLDGRTPLYTEEQIQKYRDGSDPENYPNTNWWNESIRKYAPQQQHSLSVRGGTEVVKYLTSISYFNQKDMHVSDDTDYNRFTLRSNIDVKLTEKLNLGFDLSATNQNFYGPSVKMERTSAFGGIMGRLFRQIPMEPNRPLPDPTKVPAVRSGLTISPYYMGFIEHVGFNDWNKLYGFAKLQLQYQLPLGFAAKAVFDLNRTYQRNKLRALEMPQYDYNPETGEYLEVRKLSNFDYLREENRITKNLNQQYFLTWEKSLNNHQFDAVFVHELLADNYDFMMAYRRDFDFNLNYLFAGPDLNKDNTGTASQGGRKAFIGRINYNYLGKYLIEFSSRWDGSPKFPSDTRWGYFPSASVGWRVSEESFIRDNIPMISNLKLRASHGKLGFDAAGAFQYLSTFSLRSRFIYDSGLEPGIRADALPNPNITWEKMTTSNIGFDFNLWDGRVLEGSLDYFYRLRTDVLGARIGAVPDVVGASLPQENFYEYNNRGWEFMLSHTYKIGDVSYTIGGNVATNREKTVFRDQTAFATMEAYRRGNQNGEWTDRFWAYPTDGLFQTQDEIDNLGYDIDGQGNRTIKPGDIKYIDYNGDGRISAEDMILAGRGVIPRLMFGIDLSISWKGFDLMVLLQGAGLYNYNLRSGGRDFIMPFYANNSPHSFMVENMYIPENPWMPTNTSNAIWPRFGTDETNRGHRNFNLNNELWLVNGLYMRLKNVQVGYTIPKTITQRIGVEYLKVFLAGYNVITFSKYSFIDPEIDTSPGRVFGDYHPIMGTYNFGVQMNF